MRPPPQEEFCNEKNGETANEFPVIVRPRDRQFRGRFGRRLKYLSGHSPPIFVQLPKADRFCGRLEAISRKFPLALAPL